MKKIILLFICITIATANVFAGKPVDKEPSPLSTIESQEERDSWCEKDGYASESKGNFHYWLYNSYKHHDGDISELILKIIPEWAQCMNYYLNPDYKKTSPNMSVAESVKNLMNDLDSDVSITFYSDNETSNSITVIINSYDKSSNLYTTYSFNGVKFDRTKGSWYDAPELAKWRESINEELYTLAAETYIAMLDARLYEEMKHRVSIT